MLGFGPEERTPYRARFDCLFAHGLEIQGVPEQVVTGGRDRGFYHEGIYLSIDMSILFYGF
jgi:hypothetical protein